MIETGARIAAPATSRPATAARPGFFAGCFALSGLFFGLYPAIRPFSSETGLDGAHAFASSRWILAHSLGILGFVLLGLGVLGLYLRLSDSTVAQHMVTALTLVWVGVGLTIPYYGAEAFGLHAVGQRTISQNAPSMLKPLTHDIRWEAGSYFILTGLVLLAVGSILVGRAVWHSGRFHRWSGVPLAVGLVLYIPQFTGPQSVRVAHGLLMLAGCAWLGWELKSPSREAGRPSPEPTGQERDGEDETHRPHGTLERGQLEDGHPRSARRCGGREMTTSERINLVLRVTTETAIVVALGSWGYHTGGSIPARIGLMLVAPLGVDGSSPSDGHKNLPIAISCCLC